MKLKTTIQEAFKILLFKRILVTDGPLATQILWIPGKQVIVKKGR